MRDLLTAIAVVISVAGVMGASRVAYAVDPPSIRRPARVVQVGSPANTIYTNAGDIALANGDVIEGPNWGFSTVFHLQVISNQSATDLYGYGRPHESFSGLQSYGPPGTTWGYPDAGTWSPGEGTGFADTVGAWVQTDPSVNGSDNGDVLWYTVEQGWHVVDAPGTPYAIPAGTLPAGQTAFHLNNHHLACHRAYCARDVQ